MRPNFCNEQFLKNLPFTSLMSFEGSVNVDVNGDYSRRCHVLNKTDKRAFTKDT